VDHGSPDGLAAARRRPQDPPPRPPFDDTKDSLGGKAADEPRERMERAPQEPGVRRRAHKVIDSASGPRARETSIPSARGRIKGQQHARSIRRRRCMTATPLSGSGVAAQGAGGSLPTTLIPHVHRQNLLAYAPRAPRRVLRPADHSRDSEEGRRKNGNRFSSFVLGPS